MQYTFTIVYIIKMKITKEGTKTKLLSTVIPIINGLTINSNFLKFYIISMKYFIVIHPMYRAIVTFHQEPFATPLITAYRGDSTK